ncbi:MAG: hypothetical protein ACLU9S_17440 [Oscillospiraceae bacterium]
MESAKTSAQGRLRAAKDLCANGGNLLSKVTQRGNTTSQGYSSAFNKNDDGLEVDVTDPAAVREGELCP